MDGSQELRHWGIKGQKWGVRRYQNPDGSYTEEGIKRYQKKYPYQNPDGSLTESGKKNYMKAARKNQLDYKRMSDKDLDMVNNRFNKENQYKRNVENYEKSTFKYRVKEAIIARLSGKGENGGKKKKNDDSIIANLLVKPINDALKEAFKDGKADKGRDVVEENKNKKVEKLKPEKKKPEKAESRRMWDNDGPVTNYPRLSGNVTVDPNEYTIHSGTMTRYKIKRTKNPDALIT